MKRLSALLISSTLSSASVSQEPIHSSFTSYYENKTFKNSVQKNDSVVYGIGADIHKDKSEYKFAYEYGNTNTKQPPLKDDLKTQKLFLKYGYEFDKNIKLNINYIRILEDNIAITDKGDTYGAGITYGLDKQLSFNFTQFYTTYNDFDVHQSDFNIDYRFKLDDIRIKLSSISKYIDIDEKNLNGFTKNAKNNYLTTALSLHSHYKSYHLGAAVYFDKRAFAIMNDGFKIQHHAMEFDRTYAFGIGKTISDVVIRFQYVYQRATELPINNKGVDIKNLRLIVNYKF